jgi:threonine synthase
MPLRVDYDLASIRLSPGDLAGRAPSLWRYREVLPVTEEHTVSLVEGWTPLLSIEPTLWIKDEARNPTGSFKARGMTAAVSVARLLGAKAFSAPSAGNAAGALAAYGAAAGVPVVVAMPEDTARRARGGVQYGDGPEVQVVLSSNTPEWMPHARASELVVRRGSKVNVTSITKSAAYCAPQG